MKFMRLLIILLLFGLACSVITYVVIPVINVKMDTGAAIGDSLP